jgi:hypothetical protein
MAVVNLHELVHFQDLEIQVSNSETFRVRFRFRLQKKLNIKAREYRLKMGACDVVLSPPLPEIDICDSEWLVMNTREFETEELARKFAAVLKTACEVSSVASRLGVDSGVDLPTSGFGELVKRHVREQSGIMLRDNVHGVDVFPDDSNVRIGHISATGTVRAAPNPFLADLSHLYGVVENASQKTRDIVLLLNYALMRPEPVAQIVFAFSAVEMLGQTEDWSADQKQLLKELAVSAKKSEIGSEQDREEVATAIEKGMYKLSLRQGVLRLLTSLELDHLKPIWDELYGKRSTLVHGLAPKPGADYGELAYRTVSLCGQILLKVIAREVTGANSHVDMFYKLQ